MKESLVLVDGGGRNRGIYLRHGVHDRLVAFLAPGVTPTPEQVKALDHAFHCKGSWLASDEVDVLMAGGELEFPPGEI